MDDFQPSVSAERVEELRRWHEDTSRTLHELGAHDVEYLGLRLHVPEHVFPPTPVSDLLGRTIQAEVRPDDRVLDLGCGSGINALLAAQVATDVVAVDVNPHAVAATAANAERNGLGDRVRCLESDVFDGLDPDDAFDLIVIDPPFRWFAATDLLERAITDEGYATLGRFLAEVADRLQPDGRVLLFFGTSGDVAHLDALIARAGLTNEVAAERTTLVRGEDTTYFVRRLTASAVPRR